MKRKSAIWETMSYIQPPHQVKRLFPSVNKYNYSLLKWAFCSVLVFIGRGLATVGLNWEERFGFSVKHVLKNIDFFREGRKGRFSLEWKMRKLTRLYEGVYGNTLSKSPKGRFCWSWYGRGARGLAWPQYFMNYLIIWKWGIMCRLVLGKQFVQNYGVQGMLLRGSDF